MPPVVAAVTAVASAVASVVGAVAAFVTGTTLGKILINVGLNLLIGKLTSPKTPRSVAQRQASILELSLGETAREAIFGRAATGGSLLNAWNDGPNNEWETFVIAIADHKCDALEGFWVGDRYYPWVGDGAQAHADFEDNGSCLELYWQDGSHTTAALPIVLYGVPAGEYAGAQDVHWDVAHVVVRYRISDKVWAAGRPAFRWLVRGYPCYDPRLDSTVPSGSGPQRFDLPDTHVWSENAEVCRYNFLRGVRGYHSRQVLVGPGKSALEAPPQDAIAAANACDELVPLKAGGTERRYRVSAVVRADQPWIEVEEDFAAAMGGELIDRGGGLAIDVGVPKSPAAIITDRDLLAGRQRTWQAKQSRDGLVNTVAVSYVDPTQMWESTTAPLRRSAEDIAADGEVREETVELPFVASATQAQRIAEITRRKARLQGQALIPLGYRWMQLEPGDWVVWTSARYFGGASRTFTIAGAQYEDTGANTFGLREISADAYAWNPETDELAVEAPAYLPPGRPAAAALINFDARALAITTPEGAQSSAIYTSWDRPGDATIVGVRLEYRPVGSSATLTLDTNASVGARIIDVLPVDDVDYEVRASPITSPPRAVLTTAWRVVSLSVPVVAPPPPNNFTGFQSGDNIRFTWTPLNDPTMRYEIRSGETFDLGRFVDTVQGGSTMVQWPIVSEDDEVLFWIKSVHRSGLRSETATLWVATIANLRDRNFILGRDLGQLSWPGVRHAMTPGTVGVQPVLLLDRDGAVSVPSGDYYTEVTLIAEFRARTWIEQRANAYINDLPAWSQISQPWSEFGTVDWLPDLGDLGAARLDTVIATDEPLSTALIEGWRLGASLLGVRGTSPTVMSGLTTAPGRTSLGTRVGAGGALHFAAALGGEWSVLVDVRLQAVPAAEALVLSLKGPGPVALYLSYTPATGVWRLVDHLGQIISVTLATGADDAVSIAVWQSAQARGLVVGTRRAGRAVQASAPIASAPSVTAASLLSGGLDAPAWQDVSATWAASAGSWVGTSAIGPSLTLDGVASDLELYSGSARGAAFVSRWDARGPVGFGDYAPFVVGEYTFTRASVRMRLTAPTPAGQVLSITRARVNIDVPDVTAQGEVEVPTAGAWVSFARAFYEVPSVTATQRSGTTRAVVVVEQIERTRFFVRLYASTDATTPVAGSITYAANGY